MRFLINRVNTLLGGSGAIRITDGVDEALVTDNKALLVAESGAPNFAATQVSVATTATQLVASRSTRRQVMVTNTGTTDVYVGASNVTTSSGDLIAGVEGSYGIYGVTGALYGIVGSGTQTVTVFEVWD